MTTLLSEGADQMKICMVYKGSDTREQIRHDTRVLKEISSLNKAGHKVIMVAQDDYSGYDVKIEASGLKFRCIGVKRRGPVISTLLQALKIVSCNKKKIDAIHVHDYNALAAGVISGKLLNVPIVYDSHEYFKGCPKTPGIYYSSLLEKFLAKRCSAVITVNEKIASLLEKDLQIDKPVVVSNFPRFTRVQKSNKLREILDIPQHTRIVLYQGGLTASRGLDTLVQAAEIMTDTAFVIMGDGPQKDALKKMKSAKKAENLHITGAVPLEELLDYSASADVGIHAIENTCLNNYYCLPNKVGEYLMAGLPIAVSNFPEMQEVALKNDTGVVFNPANTKDLVRALRQLLKPDVYNMKKENVMEVRDKYSWEKEEERLVNVYSKMELKK